MRATQMCSVCVCERDALYQKSDSEGLLRKQNRERVNERVCVCVCIKIERLRGY